jgi:hypothetical protein
MNADLIERLKKARDILVLITRERRAPIITLPMMNDDDEYLLMHNALSDAIAELEEKTT